MSVDRYVPDGNYVYVIYIFYCSTNFSNISVTHETDLQTYALYSRHAKVVCVSELGMQISVIFITTERISRVVK